jgi:hypothetical protein
VEASVFIIKDKIRRIQERLRPSQIFKLEIVLVARKSDFPFSELDLKKLIKNRVFEGMKVVVFTGFLDAGNRFYLSSQDDDF